MAILDLISYVLKPPQHDKVEAPTRRKVTVFCKNYWVLTWKGKVQQYLTTKNQCAAIIMLILNEWKLNMKKKPKNEPKFGNSTLWRKKAQHYRN